MAQQQALVMSRRQHVVTLFELWDNDRSGYLELEELQLVLSRWKGFSSEQARDYGECLLTLFVFLSFVFFNVLSSLSLDTLVSTCKNLLLRTFCGVILIIENEPSWLHKTTGTCITLCMCNCVSTYSTGTCMTGTVWYILSNTAFQTSPLCH